MDVKKVSLEPITKENELECIHLKPRQDQFGFGCKQCGFIDSYNEGDYVQTIRYFGRGSDGRFYFI